MIFYRTNDKTKYKNKIFLFFLMTSTSICLIFLSLILLKSIRGIQANESEGQILGASENADGFSGTSNKAVYFENSLPVNRYRQLGPTKLWNIDPLETNARASIAIDCRDNVRLQTKAPYEQYPIASITKLMTALVFLEYNPGWDTIYTISREDRVNGGRIYVYMGEKIKIRDLFHLSLVSSGNTETMALVNATGLTEVEFVKRMNEKANEIGLVKTNFNEPVGISQYNLSTANDVAMLAKEALANEDIRQATLMKKYECQTIPGRKIYAETTDNFISGDENLNDSSNEIKILGGKTGYTEAAGYCFVGWFSNDDGREIITVVLGTGSDDERFVETKKIADWVYASYDWKLIN